MLNLVNSIKDSFIVEDFYTYPDFFIGLHDLLDPGQWELLLLELVHYVLIRHVLHCFIRFRSILGTRYDNFVDIVFHFGKFCVYSSLAFDIGLILLLVGYLIVIHGWHIICGIYIRHVLYAIMMWGSHRCHWIPILLSVMR